METRGARARRATVEARALGLAALPTFAALPPAVVLQIFLALPVDSRLRCLEVSRTWRDALSGERALWTHIDLSATSGAARFSLALLQAAPARARGGLVSLGLPRTSLTRPGLFDALAAVCAANAGTLRELNLDKAMCFTFEQLGALLRAAPSLQLLKCDGSFSNAPDACEVLRRQLRFAPVRLRLLELRRRPLADEQLVEMMAACGAHASLERLRFSCTLSGSRAALEAVADAAIATRLRELLLGGVGPSGSGVNATSAPALARLLSTSTWLASLYVVCGQGCPPLAEDAPAARALSAALRANRTLRHLMLRGVGLWRDMAVAEALLGALVGHPSLGHVVLSGEAIGLEGALAAGELLAALVAADAPALQILHLGNCSLGDAGLRPLLDALPNNTHLQELGLSGCTMSAGFARGLLLAAVRANTSLRLLKTGFAAAAAAEQLVAARAGA